jgi:5-methylcytosine-specific restriction endonuclease McrA
LISEQTGVEHHIDHIIPLSRGGVHREWNLRILPATENLSKSAKFDDEWFNLTDEDIERLDAEALEFTP